MDKKSFRLSDLRKFVPSLAMAVLVIFLCISFRELPFKPFAMLVLPLFLSDFLLYKGKVWGIIPGILFGIYTIIDHFQPPRVGPSTVEIGILLIVYYIALGISVLIKNRKKNKRNI